MLKAIIFDLDNTLTDFMKAKDAAIRAAVDGMIDAGLDMPPDEARERLYEIYDREGIEYQRVFDQFLHQELGWVNPKIWAAAIVAYRRAREGTLTLYPHVQLALTELIKRGLKLAVLSDAPRQQAWLRLCYLKLDHIFDQVITFEDTGELKPSEKPFRKVLELLRVLPREALMVGDWPERDMVGAAQVGIRTVFARYGDTSGIEDSGADYEIRDIMGLLPIVDTINAGET